MSTIGDDVDQSIAARLRAAREERGWSLGELANRSGISKATLSKIERMEASPTAGTLSRIGSAFGLTLAELLTFDSAPHARFVAAVDQPLWQDPKTGYVRRQIFADPRSDLELVEVELPPGKSVTFPASVYIGRQQIVWVLSGTLTLLEGEQDYTLTARDRLQFGAPCDVTYTNATKMPCQYVVAVMRR
jgi:transcriptional regulator with XRE-family HTH domain